MPSESFYNDGQFLVNQSLKGLCLANPDLILNEGKKAISHVHHLPDKHVTLISGGGAGHEPAHAAFVGKGMLSAAVSGNIFASPSVSQIVETIGNVGGSAGTILIVKNYTGDIFHFHLAAAKARLQWGHRVEVLVVGDDVAVGRKRNGKVGRRGLAGTVLVHKILGALAAQGASFDDLIRIGRQVVDGLVTCGVSQDHVVVPGSGSKAQDEEANVELGMGIHNEPGFKKLVPRPSLTDILKQMLDMLLDKNDSDRAFVDFDQVSPVLLVNNLGATSQLELYGILQETANELGRRGIVPARILCGTFMTSLDAPGFSITLLKASSEMLAAVDFPVSAPAWPQNISHGQTRTVEVGTSVEETRADIEPTTAGPKVDVHLFKTAMTAACQSLLAAEPSITESDRLVGDGDCGATLSRGATAILDSLSEIPGEGANSASALVSRVANAVEQSMDGTSGALYEMYLNSLSAALQNNQLGDVMTPQAWSNAATLALDKLKAMTPARLGDRTIMDALIPFVEALESGSLVAAVDAARQGRDRTRGMTATLGRAVYVPDQNYDMVPDPGAEGIVAIVEGLAGLYHG